MIWSSCCEGVRDLELSNCSQVMHDVMSLSPIQSSRISLTCIESMSSCSIITEPLVEEQGMMTCERVQNDSDMCGQVSQPLCEVSMVYNQV